MDIVKNDKNNNLEIKDFFIAKNYITVINQKESFTKLSSLYIIYLYIKKECDLYENANMIYMKSKNIFPRHIKVKSLVSDIFKKENICETNYYYNLLDIKLLLPKSVFRLSNSEKRLLYLFLVLASKHDIYFLEEPFNSLDSLYIEKVKEAIIKRSLSSSIIISSEEVSFEVPHNTYNVEDKTKEIIKSEELTEFTSKDKYNSKVFVSRYNILLLTFILLLSVTIFLSVNVNNNKKILLSELSTSAAEKLYDKGLSVTSAVKTREDNYLEISKNLKNIAKENDGISYNPSIETPFYTDGSLNGVRYKEFTQTLLPSYYVVDEGIGENNIKMPRDSFVSLLRSYDVHLTEEEIDNYDFNQNEVYTEYTYDINFSFKFRVVGLTNSFYVLNKDVFSLIDILKDNLGEYPKVSHCLNVKKSISEDFFNQLDIPYTVYNCGDYDTYYVLEVLDMNSINLDTVKSNLDSNVYAYSLASVEPHIYYVTDKVFFEENFDTKINENSVVVPTYYNYFSGKNYKVGDNILVKDTSYIISGFIESNDNNLFLLDSNNLKPNYFGEDNYFSGFNALLKDYSNDSYETKLHSISNLDTFYSIKNASKVIDENSNINLLASTAKTRSNNLIVITTVLIVTLSILIIYIIMLMYKYYTAYSLIQISLLRNKIIWIITNFILTGVFIIITRKFLDVILRNSLYSSIKDQNLMEKINYLNYDTSTVFSLVVLAISLVVYFFINETFFQKIKKF